MNVRDLAADLEVDVAQVLEQCQLLGVAVVDATSELDGPATALVRIGLASSPHRPAANRPSAEPTPAPEPVAVGGGGDTDGDLLPASPPTVSAALETMGAGAASPADTTEAVPAPLDPAATQAVPIAAPAGVPVDATATAPDPNGAVTQAVSAAVVASAVHPAAAGALPPNVVASSPTELAAAEHGPLRHASEPAPDGAGHPGEVSVPAAGAKLAGPRGGATRPTTGVRRDPRLRPAAIALAVAFVAAGAAFALARSTVWVALVLLVVTGATLLDALVGASRARHRTTVHPDRYRGRGLSAGLMALALCGLVAFGLLGWLVFRAAPANEGHLGTLGRTALVQRLRWTQQRTRLVARTGWNRPAKSSGTCWTQVPPGTGSGRRQHDRPDRIESGDVEAPCSQSHRFEVLAVFAVDGRPDRAYPGATALQAIAAARCRPILATRRLPSGRGWTTTVDLPRLAGWNRADHDVACLAVAPADVKAALARA